jgi:hypothetical protein
MDFDKGGIPENQVGGGQPERPDQEKQELVYKNKSDSACKGNC